MDKKGFDEAAERLIEVNKVIAKLDPAIRSSAFELVKGYITGLPPHTTTEDKPKPAHHGGAVDLETLIAAHPDNKPNENVELLTAYWYGQHGAALFTVDNLKNAATDAGLTISDRTDMTLRQAKDGGKKLYQSAGRGLFKPTVHGEVYLKKTYGVRKGSAAPPAVDKK